MTDTVGFISDFSVLGMLYAVTIRSPIARGILRGIKCPALPFSYQLITADQIPGENRLANFSVPVLAGRDLSYIGQPVAILTGPDAARLEEISSKIKLNTEETKAVYQNSNYGEEDIIVKRSIAVGDREKTQKEDGKSIVGNYTTGMQEHWYSEVHGSLAIPAKKPMETFTVYTATQWPFHVKRSVAGVLGLDSGNVTVVPTLMMLHLDGKIWYPSLVSCHAALAALITGSPVKLMLVREEDFMFSPKKNRSNVKIRSELGEQGEILETEVQLTLDLGAGGVFEDEIIDQTCLGALGLYRHEAFRIEGIGVRTNIPYQGPMSGFGLSQGFFAAERHISRIADSLGQDPAEWRKKNLLGKNPGNAEAGLASLAIGIKLDKPAPLAELIDTAASMGDYYRKWAAYELLRGKRRSEKWTFEQRPLRGIGISIAAQGNGFLYGDQYGIDTCEVELTLEKDGYLEIKTSLGLSGAAFLEGWQNLAREILGVEPVMVRLTGDTTNVPDSGPATLSRNISSITRLVEQCCTAIRNQRFRDPLPITVKSSSDPKKTPAWVPKKNIDPEAFSNPGWGAAVVEIEMDPVSLDPVIRGIWLVVDGGRVLNKRLASRSLRTGIIQALGWACREQVLYKDGKIPPEYYRNYGILRPEEIPPINLDFFQSESTEPKGVGELPFSCIPAAYVQAVSQAMDHHFERIPLDSREIWDAWKLKQTETTQ
ncbi:MAG: molybdopterin-dependent oxidoreductase [Treponema sp.]|nr:molybdopterin-dependent oxidoreductase [Treponema sp.]